MDSTTSTQPITPESVLAAVKEMFAESSARLEKDMAESRAAFEKSRADHERRMKNLDERLGGMANNHGSFAEEYFFNAFENGKLNFFGEKFDEIEKNLKHKTKKAKYEYDIVLYNSVSVAIIEVKYKAHENDIPDVINLAKTFRETYPDYRDFKIYLGLASMSFYPELTDACEKNGIAIIKQVGETVVINDRHLKVF